MLKENVHEIDKIMDITSRIVETVHPQKVILFGSFARGDQNHNSDYYGNSNITSNDNFEDQYNYYGNSSDDDNYDYGFNESILDYYIDDKEESLEAFYEGVMFDKELFELFNERGDY